MSDLKASAQADQVFADVCASGKVTADFLR